MDLLLAAKALPSMLNRRQQTPLHVLRDAGGVEKLLRARAEVNEQAKMFVGEKDGKDRKDGKDGKDVESVEEENHVTSAVLQVGNDSC